MIVLALSLMLVEPAVAADPPPPPGVSVRQELLPVLTARRERATARVTSAEAYLRGAAFLTEAFPELDGAALGDPEALRVLRERMHRAALDRASERAAPAPSGVSDVEARALRDAIASTTGAEERADGLLTRVLTSLEAGLRTAPGYGETSVRRRLDELAAVRIPADGDPDATALAVAAADEGLALQHWRRAARNRFVRPQDGELDRLAMEAMLALPAPTAPLAGPRAIWVRGLQDRLVRSRPLLSGPVAEEADRFIEAADRAFIDAEAAVPPQPAVTTPRDADTIAAELVVAQAERDALRAARDVVASDPARTPGWLRRVTTDVDRADQRITALEGELGAARTAREAGLDPARGSSVGDAERLAEEARLASEAETASQREAELRGEVAAIRKRVADHVREESERRRLAIDELGRWREELSSLVAERESSARLSVLDPDRQRRLDAAYLALRDLARRLQEGATSAAHRASETPDGDAVTLTPSTPGDPAEVLAERAAALEDAERERSATSAAAVEEQDAVVRLLVAAKRERRAARELASAEARTIGRRAFVPELVEEIGDARLVVSGEARDASRWLKAAPARLLDLTALLAVLTGSATLLVALAAWLVGRRLLPTMASSFPWEDPDRRPAAATWLLDRLEPGDAGALRAPVSELASSVVDLGFTALLVARTGGVPIVSAAAWCALAVAAWRTWTRLAPLLVTSGSGQPAVFLAESETIALTRRTGRWLLGWWFGFAVLDALFLDLFGADRIAQVADATSTVGGLALGAWLAWQWEPAIRALAEGAEGRLGRFAASDGSRLLRIPRAVGGLLLLGWRILGNVTRDVITSTRSLSWASTLLAHRDLAGTGGGARLEDGLRARLDAIDPGPPPGVRAVVAELAGRAADGARGLVGVRGERGGGIDRVADLLGSLPGALVLRPPGRLGTEEEALGWLAASLGKPGIGEADLVHAVEDLPRRLLVLADPHLLATRRVGGFDPLRGVLRVLQACAEEHLVACCIDARLWNYFAGAPGLVDLAMFTTHLSVDAAPEQLEAWLLRPLDEVGLAPIFGTVGRGPADERRARRAWFRLLDDASQGRALRARALWLDALRSGDTAGRVEHAVPAAVALPPLGDMDLFLLHALVLHRALPVELLADVLNLPPTTVRSACLRLAASGLLASDAEGETYDVRDEVLPAVVRLLRHRAFLEAA